MGEEERQNQQKGGEKKEGGEEKKSVLKEKILAQTRREGKVRRKKLLKVGIIVGVLVAVILSLYPSLRTVWYLKHAENPDPKVRKEALEWLAERGVKRAVPVFIKALNGTRSESEFAMESLRTLAGKEIIPELLRIWESDSTEVRPYAKYNALQLIAEKGDRSHAPIFISTRVLLGEGWNSAWDFLRKWADESIVEMILKFLKSDDVLKRRAAAMALRPIKDMDVVCRNDVVLDALAGAVGDSDWVVQREALRTISGIARQKDFDVILKALCENEKPDVRNYAAEVLGELRDSRAVAALVRALEDAEGNVCLAAADALVKIRDSSCVPLLKELISDERRDSLARVKAVEVLRRTRMSDAAQVLSSVLGSSDLQVAVEAAKSLARVGNTDSVGALSQAAKSPSPELRAWAAYALGLIGETSGCASLLALLGDSELRVVKSAVHALLLIGDVSVVDSAVNTFYELNPKSDNRREVAYLLAVFRTPLAVSALIDAALSAYPSLREEGLVGLRSIGGDIILDIRRDKSEARKIALSGAAKMLDKVVSSRLVDSLKDEHIGIVSINSALLKAMREIQDENKPDRDLLESTLSELRTLYWTTVLIEDLKKLGLGEEKLLSLVRELVSITDDSGLFERVPTPELVERFTRIKREMNLPERK